MSNFINKKANAKTAQWLNDQAIAKLSKAIAEVAMLRYKFHNDDNSCIKASVKLQDDLRKAQNHLYNARHNCKCRLVYDYNRPF